jgi:hypothetical protein
VGANDAKQEEYPINASNEDKIMNNLFLEIAFKHKTRYCPSYCAKCYLNFCRDFIVPIGDAHGETPPDSDAIWRQWFSGLTQPWNEHLADELKTVPIGEFMKIEDWINHLRIAFFFIRDAEMQNSVLRHWLATFGGEVVFAEMILTHFAKSEDIREAWMQKTPPGYMQVIWDRRAEASGHARASAKRRHIRHLVKSFYANKRLDISDPEVVQEMIEQMEHDIADQ